MSTSHTLVYKDALNEIISIQDTYITSNTPDTAAFSLMVKWREKVIEYAIRLRKEEINSEKNILSVRTECSRKLEEANSKYETIINDIKSTFTTNEDITKLQESVNNLKQKLTEEQNTVKALNGKISQKDNEIVQIKEKLHCEMQIASKNYDQQIENYKEKTRNSEQKVADLELQLNSTIEKYEAEKKVLEEEYSKTSSRLETTCKTLSTEREALKREENMNKKKALEDSINKADKSKLNQEKLIDKLYTDITSARLQKEKALKEKDELRMKSEKEISELKKQVESFSNEGYSKYRKECEKSLKDNIKLASINKQLNEDCKKMKLELEIKEACIKKYTNQSTYDAKEKLNAEFKREMPIETNHKAERQAKYEDKIISNKQISLLSDYNQELTKAETVDNGCILNDDIIDAGIFKTMDNKPGGIKVTSRMLGKLNDLQKLGSNALQDV